MGCEQVRKKRGAFRVAERGAEFPIVAHRFAAFLIQEVTLFMVVVSAMVLNHEGITPCKASRFAIAHANRVDETVALAISFLPGNFDYAAK